MTCGNSPLCVTKNINWGPVFSFIPSIHSSTGVCWGCVLCWEECRTPDRASWGLKCTWGNQANTEQEPCVHIRWYGLKCSQSEKWKVFWVTSKRRHESKCQGAPSFTYSLIHSTIEDKAHNSMFQVPETKQTMSLYLNNSRSLEVRQQ